MIELFISTFITLFVVIDPVGCAPIFAGLTAGTPASHQRSMALRSSFVATLIMLAFALIGESLLDTIGVSMPAFRIAGGIMLFLIALEMVFEKRTQRRENRAEEAKGKEHEDISVFPMGIPMIAGPGAMASVMLLMARVDGFASHAIVVAALLAVMALTLFALLVAAPLIRLVGAKIEAAITRLLGVILAALAVQFIIDGVKLALG